MKKKNTTFILSVFALIGLSFLLLASCTKEKGCKEGFFGKNCDREIRSLVIGTYHAKDTSFDENNEIVDTKSYDVTISKNDSTILTVFIQNFAGLGGNTIYGEARWLKNENATLLIQTGQKLNSTYKNGISIGSYKGASNTMKVDYHLKDASGETFSYSGVWTKQ